jgi:hypothetical protein
VDYSFYDVTQETLQLGPKEAMQFGRVLERILYKIGIPTHAMAVYIGKVDLANGFYQVWLSMGAIPKLAVALPVYKGEAPMVALPLTLPMGWMDSVPYFCSPTETVADIANSKLTSVHQLPQPLEKLANTLPPDRADTTPPTLNPHVHDSSLIDTNPPVLRPYQKPTRFYDIFIDDYIMGVQGTATTCLQHL